MQKSDVFFKDFKISFIVAGLAFTVFFAVAIFCELAMDAIFKIEPSQARISLFVGVFMAIGVRFLCKKMMCFLKILKSVLLLPV